MTRDNGGTQTIQGNRSSGNDFLVYPSTLGGVENQLKRVTFHFFDPVSTIDAIKDFSNVEWDKISDGSGLDFNSFDGFLGSLKQKFESFSSSWGKTKESLFNWDKVNKLATIVLPIPNSLNDTTSLEWSSEDMPVVPELLNKVPEGIRIGTQVATGYGTPDNSEKSTFSAREYAPHPPIADPLKWAVFKSSNLRSFNFSYEFVPQNQEEAKIIATICLLFKKLSAPVSAASSVAMLPPARVKVEFSNPYLEAMLNCGVCVIDSVKTDFKGSQGAFVSTFADGFVKSLSLDITLKEFRPKYSQDYELDSKNITSDLGSLINSSKMPWNKKRNGLGL